MAESVEVDADRRLPVVPAAVAFLPGTVWSERHARAIPAPPERAIAAACAVTAADVPLARALLAARSLPALLAGRPGLSGVAGRPLLDGLLATPGFMALREWPTGFALGYVGRPWRLDGGAPREIGDFAAFAAPGYVKVLATFVAEPAPLGALLVTETRIAPTDAAARRRFAPYWAIVRPGSALVRRAWIAAAARRVGLTP